METDTKNKDKELEDLKKKMSQLRMWAKALLDNSRPAQDPLKESRYICATAFIESLLEEKSDN